MRIKLAYSSRSQMVFCPLFDTTIAWTRQSRPQCPRFPCPAEFLISDFCCTASSGQAQWDLTPRDLDTFLEIVCLTSWAPVGLFKWSKGQLNYSLRKSNSNSIIPRKIYQYLMTQSLSKTNTILSRRYKPNVVSALICKMQSLCKQLNKVTFVICSLQQVFRFTFYA